MSDWYEPAPQAVSPPTRSVGTETVERVSSPARHTSRGTETYETIPSRASYSESVSRERVVRDRKLGYEAIQRIITSLSDEYGVPVRKAGRVEGASKSSPRPPFFEEIEFLRQHVPGIQTPPTLAYGDYNGRPSQKPIVMKNETMARGQGKYLIENPDQLQRFRAWMEAHGNPNEWLAQDYLDTPGKAPTCYKVIVDCTGEIIASHISYGPPHSMHLRQNRATKGDVAKNSMKELEYADSEFCLDSRAITSNHILLHDDDQTTGGRICLNPLPQSHPYNQTERNILAAHGLDRKVPLLPKKVATTASGIGRALGMKKGQIDELVLGVDMIQKEGTDDFLLLEVNRRPSLASVRDWLGSAHSISEPDAWRWIISGSMQRVLQDR